MNKVIQKNGFKLTRNGKAVHYARKNEPRTVGIWLVGEIVETHEGLGITAFDLCNGSRSDMECPKFMTAFILEISSLSK